MTAPTWFQRCIDRAAVGEFMSPDTLVVARAEKFRHECEIRQILQWRKEKGSEWARGYLDKHPRREFIEPDIRAQWGAGNRGLNREWFDDKGVSA